MNRTERLALISQLQEKLGGPVLVFITGDRPGLASQIAEDVVRPIYEHLLKLDGSKSARKINLFLLRKKLKVITR